MDTVLVIVTCSVKANKVTYNSKILIFFVYVTHTHTFNSILSGTTRVNRYQKGKTNLDFTEARDSEWSGISWAICKPASHSRQITMLAPHH